MIGRFAIITIHQQRTSQKIEFIRRMKIDGGESL